MDRPDILVAGGITVDDDEDHTTDDDDDTTSNDSYSSSTSDDYSKKPNNSTVLSVDNENYEYSSTNSHIDPEQTIKYQLMCKNEDIVEDFNDFFYIPKLETYDYDDDDDDNENDDDDDNTEDNTSNNSQNISLNDGGNVDGGSSSSNNDSGSVTTAAIESNNHLKFNKIYDKNSFLRQTTLVPIPNTLSQRLQCAHPNTYLYKSLITSSPILAFKILTQHLDVKSMHCAFINAEMNDVATFKIKKP